jgi:RND family efflux transporter MFP subunit
LAANLKECFLGSSRLISLLLLGGVLVAALDGSLAGCGRGGDTAASSDKPEAKADTKPVTVEVSRAVTRPMETTVSAQGTLAPGQGATARVAAVVAARLLQVPVREGDRVATGQVLAVLDSRAQAAQVRSAAAALTAAEAQARQANLDARAAATDQSNAVRQAKLALDAARLDRETTVKQARIALSSAKTDLGKLRAGARQQEKDQADLTVQQDRATRDRAQTELQRIQYLTGEGIAAQRQLDDAKTAVAVADATLKSAQAQASLIHAGTRPEDLQAAQLRVDQASEALSQAQTSGQAKVWQAQAALQQAQQSALAVAAKQQAARAAEEAARQKQSDLAAAQAVAGYAVLRSPLTGVVSRRVLNPGDMADPATPIVEVTDTRTLNLLANLPAEDGVKVRRGMAVRVTAADLPGRQFMGRVVSVGQVDPQTNLLAVRISVSNPTGRLKVGTFATAEIILHTDPQAVVVPKQAVLTREGKSVVFVVGHDDVAHLKEVTLGAEQGSRVQILLGVSPGATVIRLGAYELDDGAKVRPQPSAATGE